MISLKEHWEKIMGKKTTSTFTVTVTHNGPAKDFEKIFKSKRGVSDLKVTRDKTNTEKTAPVAIYSDEQKMVRLFIKTAAEKAGLKYGGKKYPLGGQGTYAINYKDSWRKGEGYSVTLCDVIIDINFKNGIGNVGCIEIWDCRNPNAEKGKDSYGSIVTLANVKTAGARYRRPFNIVDPKAEEMLTNLFEIWGNLY